MDATSPDATSPYATTPDATVWLFSNGCNISRCNNLTRGFGSIWQIMEYLSPDNEIFNHHRVTSGDVTLANVTSPDVTL